MMTRGGVLVLPENNAAPSLADIAVGSSRMPRFGGATYDFWSVAEHAMVCALIARQFVADRDGRAGVGSREELQLLLHDAHECITADVPSTWKTADLKALQHELDRRIFPSLGLDMPDQALSDFVSICDRAALLAESKLLAPPGVHAAIRRGVGCGGVPQPPPTEVALDAVLSIKSHAFTMETAGTYYYGWVRRLLTKWRTA